MCTTLVQEVVVAGGGAAAADGVGALELAGVEAPDDDGDDGAGTADDETAVDDGRSGVVSGANAGRAGGTVVGCPAEALARV